MHRPTSCPVGMCLASLTLAKFPFPIVLSSLYFPTYTSSPGGRDHDDGRLRLLDEEELPPVSRPEEGRWWWRDEPELLCPWLLWPWPLESGYFASVFDDLWRVTQNIIKEVDLVRSQVIHLKDSIEDSEHSMEKKHAKESLLRVLDLLQKKYTEYYGQTCLPRCLKRKKWKPRPIFLRCDIYASLMPTVIYLPC